LTYSSVIDVYRLSCCRAQVVYCLHHKLARASHSDSSRSEASVRRINVDSNHPADSALVSTNEINLRRARLVLGRVNVSGFSSRCEAFISVCYQPPRSTQPGHSFVGRRNEYRLNGGDALRLGVKAGMVRVWWQVKLCDALVTHVSYPSALEIHHDKALYKFTLLYSTH